MTNYELIFVGLSQLGVWTKLIHVTMYGYANKLLSSSGTFLLLSKRWLLSKAGFWHVEGNLPVLPWDEATWWNWTHGSSRTELLLLLHCHPQSNTQFSFPAAVAINAQFDHINTKWCRFLDILHIIKLIIFFLFSIITHCMVTAPSRRSSGEVSCFWRWRLWPLYNQYPVVRRVSKIYTWMQNSIWQFYMNRKPRFEVFGL